jgi:hypothetical protein
MEIGGCSDSVKFHCSPIECESCPASSGPALAGGEPDKNVGNRISEAYSLWCQDQASSRHFAAACLADTRLEDTVSSAGRSHLTQIEEGD